MFLKRKVGQPARDIKDTVTIECLKRIIIPLRPMFGGSCKVESNDVSFYKYRKGQSLSRPPTRCCSSVQTLRSQVLADLALPFISIREEFFLVVQQLLVRVRRVLKVGTLDDGIHGARLLAEPAVDALCHVDVVPSGTPAAVLALLRLDGDGLRGADGLAQLASDAALLTRGVATQDVLAAEARAQRTLLERVVDLRDGRWVDGRGWNQGSESVGRVLVIREPGRGPRQGSSAGIWDALTVTLGSQKYFIARDMPRNISVRNRVCAEASRTAIEGSGIPVVRADVQGLKRHRRERGEIFAYRRSGPWASASTSPP